MHKVDVSLGGRRAALFFLVIPVLGNLSGIIAAYFGSKIPVIPAQGNPYGYLMRHWEFGWIALAMFGLMLLCTWMSRCGLRQNVLNDIALARRHGGVEVECPLRQIPIEKIPELRELGALRLVERRKRA
jgi:hypothetical protein